MKITTDLVSKFVDQETVNNWSETCTSKLTIAYDRHEHPCLIVHDCWGCKVYSYDGFKFKINMPGNLPTFKLLDLDTHGLEIYKDLDDKDYFPTEIVGDLITKNTKDYFWIIHQKTQNIICVLRDGINLYFYENKEVVNQFQIQPDLSIQELLNFMDYDLICPG
jgi:hypothetical protein